MDFNLFPVFVEIMRHRNISKASKALGLTQPATSNALARLRDQIGDPLFIRASKGVIPTEYALEIADRIENAVEDLRKIAIAENRRVVNLKEIKRTFRIVASDLEDTILVPKIVEELSHQAPNVQLEIKSYNYKYVYDEFQLNQTDIFLCYLQESYRNVLSKELFYQDFLCAVRKGHPIVKKRLTLKQYLSLGHILVSPDRGGFHGLADDKLKEMGLSRNVVISTPHFLSGCQLCATTDYLITLPRYLAEHAATLFNLELHQSPVDLEGFTVRVYWHRRLDKDPEHIAIRNMITEVVRKDFPARD